MSNAASDTQQAPQPTLVQSSKVQSGKVLETAATHAVHVLDALIADGRRCPHFLPRCKAVIICTVYRAGFGLALEHGSGLLLARLPTSGKAMCVQAFASWGRHGWSAPAFVSVDGLSGGVTAGVQKADTLIGIMTDAALERIVSGGTTELGAGWSVSLLDLDSESTSSYHDMVVCPLASGLMLDASLSCCRLRLNGARIAKAYGEGVTARQLLYGDLPPPQAALPLVRRLCEVEGHAMAAAFEPSVNSEKDAW